MVHLHGHFSCIMMIIFYIFRHILKDLDPTIALLGLLGPVKTPGYQIDRRKDENCGKLGRVQLDDTWYEGVDDPWW